MILGNTLTKKALLTIAKIVSPGKLLTRMHVGIACNATQDATNLSLDRLVALIVILGIMLPLEDGRLVQDVVLDEQHQVMDLLLALLVTRHFMLQAVLTLFVAIVRKDITQIQQGPTHVRLVPDQHRKAAQ